MRKGGGDMKATLVECWCVTDTGDIRGAYRPETRKAKAILFEGEDRWVIFLPGHVGRSGELFRITDISEDGRVKLDLESVGLGSYCIPCGPLTFIRELNFTNDQIEAALVFPGIRDFIRGVKKLCDKLIRVGE